MKKVYNGILEVNFQYTYGFKQQTQLLKKS